MSSETNPRNDSIDSAQTGGPTDLDLAPPDTEPPNDEKISTEENIDSNFMIEAVHYKNEGKIVVLDPKQQDQLRNKGFGEVFNKEYLLNSLESLFLLQNNKIKIYRNKTEYDFSTFLKTLIKKDKKILTKYLIFRDLRSKGYVIKEGFGFGTDFRIYERGEYNKKTSRYVSVGLNEGTNIKASEFAEFIEQVENMGKSVVIAVVERRGEVIYYKTSKMTFFDNKKSKN
ncbi:MAG: tRNA-intron lyase [Candidatus Nitrosocosmicus sp.]|nr:tRNA-intron lyase [Candidatus Nitrosocosmicus sp.]MDN5866044.1 tRNA-intron lyase [Candidatus Nitrosocosmicus sp.]